MEDEIVYSDAEVEIEGIRAHDRECIGCQRHDKDVMISYSDKNREGYTIKDLFLDQSQAESLLKELTRVVSANNGL